MNNDPEELLRLAHLAVDRVTSVLISPEARNDLGIDTKSSPTDMVTAMDRWAETTIVETLMAERPDDGLQLEEGSDKNSASGVVWIIDPIDGTTNFVRNLPGFSVSIAARVDGVDTVGLVDDPIRGERFTAVLGDGAFCNDVAIRVSSTPDLAHAIVATGFGYRAETRRRQGEVVRDLLPLVADIRRFGGAALDCCQVAAGRLEAYYETGVQEWDVAAGGLIVREAGGTTVDHRPDGPFVCGSAEIVAVLEGLVSAGDQ